MADTTTVIGRSSFVRGRIAGSGDLEIAGRVEGDVSVSGEVTIEATGLVAANVSARRIVVRGAVKGDLTADESLHLETGARVVGDLKAARIAIAQGGLVKGFVSTSGQGAPRARSTAAAAVRVPVKAAAPPPAPAKKAPPPPPPPPARVSKANGKKPGRGATLAGARVPPPPVVPVLKKGTKAVHKKRG